MWPATVTRPAALGVGRTAHDELLGEPVDEVRAVDVPADVEPDERDATPLLDRHDLTEQDRRVLRQRVAWLAADGDPERTEVARQDRGVRVEIDRPLMVARRGAEPAADIDLADRDARRRSAVRPPRRRRQSALEGIEAVGQPARPGVEMDRVDREVVRAAAAIASSSRSRPIPNLVGRSPLYSRWSL